MDYSKLKSRKFWVMIAAFLSSLGTSIAGLAIQNQTVTVIGAVCTMLSGAIYAACEAYIDGKREASSTTADNTTTVVQKDSK